MVNSVNLKASVSFVGDGSTNRFYFGFDYINKQFVKVQVGAESSPLTYLTDYTVDDRSVTLTDTPAVGVAIRVYRETPSDRIVEWADGAFIKASQMTLESLQQLHLIEEAHDYPILSSLSKYPDGINFNALSSRITGVSDPIYPQDVVTKHYMESVQDGFVARNTSLLEQATTQATSAKNSAYSSATSASHSASSASASETSNQSAKKWAEATDSPNGEADTDSTTGKTQSSKTWALYSKTKAQESATSATNAKSSETNAKTSETHAKTSETNAKSSETKAKTSETNAKSSEINASASASASVSSASASATSATNAHNSEIAAANSAKQAAESAGVFQDFQGATASTDGNGGKVPKPLAGQQNKVLKADGTWGDGVTPKALWDGMHSYPENYVPSDVSNLGWNQLGLCSIYYSRPTINKQPSPCGQLINIPADLHNESTQLWIEQNIGNIYSRGGNIAHPVDDTPFKRFARLDDVEQVRDAIRTLRKRTYPTVLDDDELTVIMNGPIEMGDIVLSRPYTDFDGLLFVCTDDYHNKYTRKYISSIEITHRKEESIKLNNPSFNLFDGYIYWNIKADSNFSPTYFKTYDENCIIERIYGVKFKDITP